MFFLDVAFVRLFVSSKVKLLAKANMLVNMLLYIVSVFYLKISVP